MPYSTSTERVRTKNLHPKQDCFCGLLTRDKFICHSLSLSLSLKNGEKEDGVNDDGNTILIETHLERYTMDICLY